MSSDGNIFDLSKYGADETPRAVRNIFDTDDEPETGYADRQLQSLAENVAWLEIERETLTARLQELEQMVYSEKAPWKLGPKPARGTHADATESHREYITDLIERMYGVLESTTKTPSRESLVAMIGAVIGVHIQYSNVGGALNLDDAPQWLEAIEKADPAVARFTRALGAGND